MVGEEVVSKVISYLKTKNIRILENNGID
jgi:hypothetical protein